MVSKHHPTPLITVTVDVGASDAPITQIGASSSQSESTSTGLRKVYIAPNLMKEFRDLALANTRRGDETCGVLCASLENEIFYATTLIVPKQEGTPSTCHALNDDEIFKEQNDRNLITIGWIHTHPSQKCFMSSVDLHTQYSYQMMVLEAIAIVVAPTDKKMKEGIFRITEPGMRFLSGCTQKGFHPHPDSVDGRPLFEHCSHVYSNPNLRFEIVDQR